MAYRFKRFRRSSRRRFRPRRIFKRKLYRRMFSKKPHFEIKHIDQTGSFNVSTSTTLVTEITPPSIPIGVLQQNATGRWVKSRNLTFESNFHVSTGDDPSIRIAPYRVVIASPRIDQDLFLNYFNASFSFNAGTSVDPAIATVYHDYIYPLANPFWVPIGATQSLPQASSPWGQGKIKKYIKFPRKIQLANNGELMDSKDKCFIIVRTALPVDPVNPTFVFHGWRSKLSFIDI